MGNWNSVTTTQQQPVESNSTELHQLRILQKYVNELCKLSKMYSNRGLQDTSLDQTACYVILEEPSEQLQIAAVEAFVDINISLSGVLLQTPFEKVVDHLLIKRRDNITGLAHGSDTPSIQTRIDRYYELQGELEHHKAVKEANLKAHQWLLSQ